MTGKEIKDYAESYLDEQIDDVDALRAINRALNLLGDTALVNDTQEYDNVAANVWLDLPADLINVAVCGRRRKHQVYRLRSAEPGRYASRKWQLSKVYTAGCLRPIEYHFLTLP